MAGLGHGLLCLSSSPDSSNLGSSSGSGIMQTVLSHWRAYLDVNRLGPLLALVSVAPAVWRLGHAAWRETYTWVRQFLVASVTIPARDALNRSVVAWVLAHVVEPRRNVRFFTARSEVQLGRGDVPERATLRKSRREVRYLPQFEEVWFWHAGHAFLVRRPLDSVGGMGGGDGYDGLGSEEVSVSCLGRSAKPVMDLIQTCREWADGQTQFFVTIYTRDRYGISWQPRSRKPIRRLETVHFDRRVKQELLADVRKYLDPRTQRRYQSRSMPYRRGYLLYGPPGTGKTSLSVALAGEFGLDLYELKIPSVASDQDLEQMFQDIPPQCIVLLEDVDAVWREPQSQSQSQDNGATETGAGVEVRRRSGERTNRSNCTLSGLLNVLDGVGSQEGRIVIMTTNKPEWLDSALVRPGRIDMKVFLGNISQACAEEMFLRMFAPELNPVDEMARRREKEAKGTAAEPGGGSYLLASLDDLEMTRNLAAAFARQVPGDTFTPSQLQGYFQRHLDSPVEAVASVAGWVEAELSKKSMVEDIEIVGSS